MGDNEINARTDRLSGAFARGEFAVDKESDVFVYNCGIGMVATHTRATIGRGRTHKKV